MICIHKFVSARVLFLAKYAPYYYSGFPQILKSPGIFFSKFKALKILENRVGPCIVFFYIIYYTHMSTTCVCYVVVVVVT